MKIVKNGDGSIGHIDYCREALRKMYPNGRGDVLVPCKPFVGTNGTLVTLMFRKDLPERIARYDKLTASIERKKRKAQKTLDTTRKIANM